MLQHERIKEVYNLLSQVWQEMEQGYIDNDEDLLQDAVYCQVNINRIVYRLNVELEKQIRQEGEKPTDKQIAYAEKLAKANDLDLDDVPFTKKDYSEFIDEWKEWQ